MYGKLFGQFALALALTLPAGAALAAPNLGSDWILVSTAKKKTFRPSPAALGQGRWKLSSVRDRRYFVPMGAAEVTGTEQDLYSSKLLKSQIEKTPESIESEKVPGTPQVSEAESEVEAPKGIARQAAGREITSYEVSTFNTIKETTTTTPFQTWDNASWQERVRKTLKNTYKVKSYLTFTDPITKEQKSGQAVKLAAPVEEIAYTAWQEKNERRKGKAGKDVTKTRSIVATRTTAKRMASVVTAATTNLAAGAALSQSLAYSSGANAGAPDASFARNTDRITGAQNARSKGGRGMDFDALEKAASAGLNLIDDQGGTWRLAASGGTIRFMPAGGPAVILPKGAARGRAGAVDVRLEAFGIRDGSLVLSGKFSRGDAHSKTLRSI